MIHVAVLKPLYIDAILEGRKTIESRLSITRREPFGLIHSGERIYFKARAGPFGVTARAGRIEFFEALSPADVDRLRRDFTDRVGGEPAYWRAKRSARFATMIHLEEVEPIGRGPVHPPFNGRAWIRLPDRADIYPDCLAAASGRGAAPRRSLAKERRPR